MTKKTHAFVFIKKIFFHKGNDALNEAPLMNFILIRAKWRCSICRHRSSSIYWKKVMLEKKSEMDTREKRK